MEKKRFEQIDGLRALAVFLVVTSHTAAFGLQGQGGLGVDIFFVLSGFFCILPFLKDKKGYKDFKSVLKYFIKKIIRIIPLYYIVILSVFFIDGNTNNIKSVSDLIKNMLFIECDGHLWYLQQEMFFYLITPLLIRICCFVSSKFKIKDKYMFIILFISSILLNVFLTENVVHFYSNGQNQKIRIGIFLLGFAFGYLYNYLSNIKIELNNCRKYIMDIVSFVIILASIFSIFI